VTVRQYQIASLRRQIGMVLQPPLIFPLSVADNIAYGRPGADHAAIENAARSRASTTWSQDCRRAIRHSSAKPA
jgi:ABC-type multidrug transport system fused ATPase/permease subunit